MSFDTARVALFNFIDTNWTDCDMLFQGQKITDSYIKRQTPWMYTTIAWGDHRQMSSPASNTYFSTLGIIAIKIYVREASGLATTDQLTDSLFSMFRMQKISDTTITDMNIDADQNADGWNIRFVSISFNLRTIENTP